MVILRRYFKRIALDERGATAIEYSLVVAIIAVAVVGIAATGGAVDALFNSLSNIVSGLGASTP